MVTQVSRQNQSGLTAQGFGMEFTGFEYSEIPLYAHVEKPNKKVGEVVVKFRVNDRKHLADHEALYLARKGSAGLFPWKPGAECMAKKFQDENISQIGDREAKLSRGKVYQGCKWCRERPLNLGSEDRAVLEVTVPLSSDASEPSRVSVLSRTSAAPVPTTKYKFMCPLCEDGGGNTDRTFKKHMTIKHSSTPPKRGTRKRAGKGKTK